MPRNKEKSTPFGVDFMVDDTRLELVTSRTSSGCATSCANRPGRLAGCIVHDKAKNVKLFFKKISAAGGGKALAANGADEKTKTAKPELRVKNGGNPWILRFVEPRFYKSTP